MIYLAIFLFVLMLFALNSINWYQYFEGFLARYGYSIDSLTKATEYKKIGSNKEIIALLITQTNS